MAVGESTIGLPRCPTQAHLTQLLSSGADKKMSGFADDDEASSATEDMEFMEEVEVDMANAPADMEGEDDDMEADDIGEKIEDQDTEDVEDMSYVTFSGHSDSVYCSSIHPVIPGIILTGKRSDQLDHKSI